MARRSPVAVLLTTLVGVAWSPPGGAQARPAERGWIGVSVELPATFDPGRDPSMVTVTDVVEGSPAARAGIRPGDVLVSLNGRPGAVLVSMSAIGDRADRGLEFRPGEEVRMVLERDGARREIRVRAGSRPEAFRVATTWAFTTREDSVADRVFRAMDSLRVRLFRDEGGGITVVGRAPAGAATVEVVGPPWVVWDEGHVRTGSEPFGIPTSGRFPEVRAPFTLMMLEAPVRDSLRSEMEHLNVQIRTLRERHTLRARQLDASGRVTDHRNDPELLKLEGALTGLRVRSEELQQSIENSARAEFGRRFRLTTTTSGDPATEIHLTPLAPYVLGQNRAAGAEVVDLQPELADYFGVDGGVLVVDVAEGTPAALAGVLPGDVITHVNTEPVGSITQLRLGLARGDTNTVVQVVRKGRPLTLRLAR